MARSIRGGAGLIRPRSPYQKGVKVVMLPETLFVDLAQHKSTLQRAGNSGCMMAL